MEKRKRMFFIRLVANRKAKDYPFPIHQCNIKLSRARPDTSANITRDYCIIKYARNIDTFIRTTELQHQIGNDSTLNTMKNYIQFSSRK
jgi:hypothetical protein